MDMTVKTLASACLVACISLAALSSQADADKYKYAIDCRTTVQKAIRQGSVPASSQAEWFGLCSEWADMWCTDYSCRLSFDESMGYVGALSLR